MCVGTEGTVIGLAGDTIDVATATGKRTCLWTAAEMPKMGDRVLIFADLGLGVVPEQEPRPVHQPEEA
jgi:hypothetical protein